MREFDFPSFNEQRYEEAFRERNEAEMLSDVLYPNDDTDRGKRLRLKQQYFFVSASLQCLMARYEARYGREYSHFPEVYAVQLNDTHPTVAIPELLRLFMERGELSYEEAFPIVRSTFAYTNHTIMAEALEKWVSDCLCPFCRKSTPILSCSKRPLPGTKIRSEYGNGPLCNHRKWPPSHGAHGDLWLALRKRCG